MPGSTLDINDQVRAISIDDNPFEVKDEPITFQEAWHHTDPKEKNMTKCNLQGNL